MRYPDRKQQFWARIKAWADRRLEKAYLKNGWSNRQCPNCRRWTHETFGAAGLRSVGDWHEEMTCSGCGYKSIWFCGSMLPVLNDPKSGQLSDPRLFLAYYDDMAADAFHATTGTEHGS